MAATEQFLQTGIVGKCDFDEREAYYADGLRAFMKN